MEVSNLTVTEEDKVFSNRLENSEETYAQSFLKYVKLELDEVKRNFIKIGFRLNEANEYEYYKELGYTNIVELAEAEFGFKKSTTYALMKIQKYFCANNAPMSIAPQYENYSYTQLLALSSAKHVGTAFWGIVRPTDSVSKLKRFVSNWNKEYKSGCGFHKELKTVDDYLNYAEEQKEEQYIQKSKTILARSEITNSNVEFSNRLENSDEKPNSGSISKQTNIEYLRQACSSHFSFLIAKCICEMPDSFGEGMPYQHRLTEWLGIWCLQDFEGGDGNG